MLEKFESAWLNCFVNQQDLKELKKSSDFFKDVYFQDLFHVKFGIITWVVVLQIFAVLIFTVSKI